MKNPDPPQIISFTDRQVEIIKSWVEYKSVAMAAEKMEIKEETFHTHLKRMRKKIAVHRTVDVYLYMKENNIIWLRHISV